VTPIGPDSADPGDRSDADSTRERVALDTSLLMAPIERDLRPLEELRRVVPHATPVVPESVVTELRALSTEGGETGTAAGVGAGLAERLDTVAAEPSYADDALVALAAADRVAYVATVDAELRERVLARDVPVICLRGESKLAVTR
jgi:SSU processome protein Utp24